MSEQCIEITTGPLAIRDELGRLKREIVVCVVKNPVTNMYLCLQWNQQEAYSFVGGGIEEGETREQTGRREIEEETGYTDLKYIGSIGSVVHQKAFAPAKNINYETFAHGLFFEVLSDRRSPDWIERSHKKPVWKRENEIAGIGRNALDMVKVREYYLNQYGGWHDGDAVAIFSRIRDLPYRIPLAVDEQNLSCSGKCMLLKKELEAHGYGVRYRVCDFLRSELGLPDHITSVAHDDESTHVYLEVTMGNATVIVDPTRDTGLSSVLPVSDRDGTSSTRVAVPVKRLYSYEESEVIMAGSAEEEQRDLERNGKFYAALNTWLETVRSVH